MNYRYKNLKLVSWSIRGLYTTYPPSDFLSFFFAAFLSIESGKGNFFPLEALNHTLNEIRDSNNVRVMKDMKMRENFLGETMEVREI